MTVQRHVYLKFKDEFSNAAGIEEVAQRTPQMLSTIPEVVALHVGRPSDERSAIAWDLVLIVEFASADDVDPYREHPAHLTYYHDYLKPRLEVIKAWNFTF